MRIIYIVIAILLAVDNVFINFKIGSISYDRLLEFAIFFYFFKPYLNEIRVNSFFRKWNNFIILFALVQCLMNLRLSVLGEMEFKYVYIGLFKCFSFIVYSFLFLLIAKKNLKLVNIIVYVHFAICIFAFLQHPVSPIASQMLEIKKILYGSVQDGAVGARLQGEETYISGGFGNRFRLAGPFATAISFSYFAISGFIINFYLYLRYKRKMYLFFLTVIFLASILSQTRSLLLAEISLVFGYLFFAPYKRQGLYKMAIVVGAAASILFIYVSKDFLSTGNSRITSVSSSGHSDSRPFLWITGMYAVIQHPFGVTEKGYQEAKREMFRRYKKPEVLFIGTHNGLINIGFQYTIIGYFLFFLFVLFLLHYINLLEPLYVVFFRLVLFSYLVHTTFHNNFILNADYPFLMVLMLICVDYYKTDSKAKVLNKRPSMLNRS